jgi:hypothetical protein
MSHRLGSLVTAFGRVFLTDLLRHEATTPFMPAPHTAITAPVRVKRAGRPTCP